jgi:phosphoglycolate phosphatase
VTCAALLFDLDGTLVDSRADIAEALRAALVDEGFAALGESAVVPLIGDGARVLVERALALQGVTAPEARGRTLAAFERRYAEHPCRHTRLLPGALEALAVAPNGLVTNKTRALTLLVLDGLGVAARFGAEAIYAGGDGPLKPAPDGVLRAAAALGFPLPDPRVWLVGDGPQDVAAGKRAGCFTVVVPGIGSLERVRAEGPDLYAESLVEVAALAREARRLTSA